MRRTYMNTTTRLAMVVLGCGLLAACGSLKDSGHRGEQAIQLVKASSPQVGAFSVISNIEKLSQDNGRKGDPWELGAWEAGFPSRKDQISDFLSNYFSFTFKPTGNYWVRFSYKDKGGVHEASWDTNVYSKKVTPTNEVAKQLSAAGIQATPAAPPS